MEKWGGWGIDHLNRHNMINAVQNDASGAKTRKQKLYETFVGAHPDVLVFMVLYSYILDVIIISIFIGCITEIIIIIIFKIAVVIVGIL